MANPEDTEKSEPTLGAAVGPDAAAEAAEAPQVDPQLLELGAVSGSEDPLLDCLVH